MSWQKHRVLKQHHEIMRKQISQSYHTAVGQNKKEANTFTFGTHVHCSESQHLIRKSWCPCRWSSNGNFSVVALNALSSRLVPLPESIAFHVFQKLINLRIGHPRAEILDCIKRRFQLGQQLPFDPFFLLVRLRMISKWKGKLVIVFHEIHHPLAHLRQNDIESYHYSSLH